VRRLLCLVTDRRRLTAAIGRPLDEWPAALAEQARGAIAGGADLIQIRERGIDAGRLADVARQLVALARGSATRIVVNDRIDVALAVAADGVHLREDGVPPSLARALAPALMIGRSVHGVEGALASGGADYVMAGSIFPTLSKPGLEAGLGLVGLRKIVVAMERRPVLAVGGVTVDNLATVAQTGAAGIAAIGAFVPPEQVSDLEAAVQMLTKSLRIAFDSATTVP
jgi:thiamine-phosphate pyrophosphorylase